MDKEIKAIEKNDTWELASLPDSQKPIRVKWFSKEKKNASSDSWTIQSKISS